ncbi:hypothetical protein F4820DRAFT_448129 [Hypoxylon rubiginosum]|uniref:Uncharacterized protein n=1 Tax=Hypoxylon rubiginosum TaxID=110542 RepID=A0ACB9Z1H4_9PEZI|nr:hypothetical protein F4820DRAFT_448129 [Hypoxylon rubiginosum]
MRVQKCPRSHYCAHCQKHLIRRVNATCSICLRKKELRRLDRIPGTQLPFYDPKLEEPVEYLEACVAKHRQEFMRNQLEAYGHPLLQNNALGGSSSSRSLQNTQLGLHDAREGFDMDSLNYTVPVELQLSLSNLLDDHPNLALTSLSTLNLQDPPETRPLSLSAQTAFPGLQLSQTGSIDGHSSAFGYPMPQGPSQAQLELPDAVNSRTGITPYIAGASLESPYIGPNYSMSIHMDTTYDNSSNSETLRAEDDLRTPSSSEHSFHPDPELQQREYALAGEQIRAIHGSQPARVPVELLETVTHRIQYEDGQAKEPEDSIMEDT